MRYTERDSVHEYTIWVREPGNGWYKPERRHVWAHNSDEAAELFTEETGGKHQKIAVESNACKVFKTYEVRPVSQFEVVPA